MQLKPSEQKQGNGRSAWGKWAVEEEGKQYIEIPLHNVTKALRVVSTRGKMELLSKVR